LINFAAQKETDPSKTSFFRKINPVLHMDNLEENIKKQLPYSKNISFASVIGKLVHMRKSGSTDLIIEEANDRFIELCPSYNKQIIGKNLLGIFPEFAGIMNDPVITEGITGDLFSGASFDVGLPGPDVHLKVYFSKPDLSSLSFMIKVNDGQAQLHPKPDQNQLHLLNSIFSEFEVNPEKNIGIIVAKTNAVLKGACSLYNRYDEKEKSLFTWAGENAPADFKLKDTADGHICYETVIKVGKGPVAISDIQDTVFYNSDPMVKKYNFRSYLGHPVVVDGKVVGSLCILDTVVRHFTETEKRAIAALAIALSLEHKRYFLEQNLTTAMADARLASEAKSQFLSNMSHEIRTPLNGIMGFSEILINEESDPRKKWMLELIEESGKQLTKIVNDVFDYSAADSGKIVLRTGVFNLPALVSETVSFFLEEANRKGLQVVVDHTQVQHPDLAGDYFKLSQILVNLLSNAVKFTEKGSILVQVSTKKEMRNIVVEIVISDTGIGIQDADIEMIFDDFRQIEYYLTKRIKGTGIGLTTTKKIVEFLGGTIVAESKPGDGSRFTVSLPFQEQSKQITREPKPELSSPRALNTEGVNILLAEDNETNQFLIKAITKSENWNITVVDNGEKAVDAYKNNVFNLILMDVQMPVMNGYEATRIIREMEKGKGIHTPIIALTAYAMKDDKEMCLDAGMDDYISKPFKRQQFIDTITQKLGGV
jgi:signal transduction histidine kinase/CheY-like chemotaxis protein